MRGVLPALLAARAAGRERAIVAVGNLSEAALATGMSVVTTWNWYRKGFQVRA